MLENCKGKRRMDKQKAGFKFGKYRLTVIAKLGSIQHNGRTYSLVKVQTHDEQIYLSLRLYNAQGRFIKQLLFEPEIKEELCQLLRQDINNA